MLGPRVLAHRYVRPIPHRPNERMRLFHARHTRVHRHLLRTQRCIDLSPSALTDAVRLLERPAPDSGRGGIWGDGAGVIGKVLVERGVVSRSFASWNQLDEWLRLVEAVRRVA